MADVELHQQLGRIEGKLDAAVSSMSRAHERLDKHDEKISKIENFQSRIIGYTAAAATVLSLTGNYIIKKMGM
jgi:hypothetical protein